MDGDALVATLHAAADAVAATLARLAPARWGERGDRPGQVRADVECDRAAVAVLTEAGLGVLSEESGLQGPDDVVVVLDPLDGTSNAVHGIPWYASSLCAVVDGRPRAAVVADLVRGVRWQALDGGGAWRSDPGAPSPTRVQASATTGLDQAIVGVAGPPPAHPGWRQYRALGAAALDLCLVAQGTLDAYADCSADRHGPWDYLGGLLICREAGAVVRSRSGEELVVIDPAARRAPLAAANEQLWQAVAAALDGRGA